MRWVSGSWTSPYAADAPAAPEVTKAIGDGADTAADAVTKSADTAADAIDDAAPPA